MFGGQESASRAWAEHPRYLAQEHLAQEVFSESADQPASILVPSLGKKPELKACEANADIFHCASLKAELIRHHPQTPTQLLVALSDMVSNFAAFKCREQGIGNPPPGYSLHVLELLYFAA